jgi:DNA-binding transcriptional regulator LsrR (DeoR family)
MLHHVREGKDEGPEDLARRLNHQYPGLGLSRETFSKAVMRGAIDGKLIYDAPELTHPACELRDRLKLDEAVVVSTACAMDVARRGAAMLLGMVQNLHRVGHRDVVHIGLAGGHTTRHLARAFAAELRKRPRDLPSKLVFHTMVAGFDENDPLTDPVVFCSYFADDPKIRIAVEFVILHAPHTVWTAEYQRLRELPGIREVYEAGRELNIIVTSGAEWVDSHSALARYCRRSKATYEGLCQLGVTSDILWRPMGPHGPIDDSTLDIRAMTLMDLEDLPGFIDRGGQVLLVVGPCFECSAPRQAIFESLLGCPDRLITHLVTDSTSAPRPSEAAR